MGCNGSEACFLDFFDGLEGGYPRGTAVEILRRGGAQATVPASKWGVSGEKRRIKIISAVTYHVKKAEKQDKNCVKAFLKVYGIVGGLLVRAPAFVSAGW